jgi:hypothetical protein
VELVGEKLAVAPDGRPATVKVTLPVNPPNPVMATASETAPDPAVALTEALAGVSAKLGVSGVAPVSSAPRITTCALAGRVRLFTTLAVFNANV